MPKTTTGAQKTKSDPGVATRAVETTILNLIDSFHTLLIDAYGVLVTHSGVLPGAQELLGLLTTTDKPYYVLSNDASRTPETTASDYLISGLSIPPERILNSGTLIADYFAAEGLEGRRCAVLGPPDSHQIVEQAGGRLVVPTEGFDVLVIGDEEGFPFVEAVDEVVTELFHRFDADQPVRLVCPNPDLVYPAGQGRFGITSGSVAALIETVLAQRYPARTDTTFVRLGKPNVAIFAKAARLSGTRNMVMIGDSLATDIAGASAFGIASALVLTGLATDGIDFAASGVVPDFILTSLRSEAE